MTGRACCLAPRDRYRTEEANVPMETPVIEGRRCLPCSAPLPQPTLYVGDARVTIRKQFIVYKAARAGVPVVFVDPANTSRTCPTIIDYP